MDVHKIAPLPAPLFYNQPPPPLFFSKRSKKREPPYVGDKPAPQQAPPPGPVQLSVGLRAQPLQAARKRKSDERTTADGEEKPMTVREKRACLLFEQKERYKNARIENTQIHGVDSTQNDFFEPLWYPIFAEIMLGRTESLTRKPLSLRQREKLAQQVKHTYCYTRWMSAVNTSDLCWHRAHVDLEKRNDALQFSTCANAHYFDVSRDPTTVSCFCSLTNSVVLCNDLCHKHTKEGWSAQIEATHTEATDAFDFENAVESIDRYRDRLTFGSFNQNIVASNTFGNGTRDRWNALLYIADHLCPPVHSIALFNDFDNQMFNNSSMRELRHCIDTFADKSPLVYQTCKPIDRRMALLPRTISHLRQCAAPGDNSEPRFVRDAGYLDANHPAYWRFNACDANQTTLALLLFVEATGNSLWLRTWTLWTDMLKRHCESCSGCRRRVVDFLCCIALLNQLTPNVIGRNYMYRLSELLEELKTMMM